jgi:hypothetical protein
LSATVAVLLAAPALTHAAIVQFVVDGGTSNAMALVQVDDAAVESKIQITVNIVADADDNNNIGDLVGVFFNLQQYPFTGLSAVSFDGPTAVAIDQSPFNGLSQAGQGCNNLNGDVAAKFDVGLQFSTCGANEDLLTSATFTMDNSYDGGNTVLNAFSFLDFGIRLQAVGPAPDGGGTGAKLYGNVGVCLDCEVIVDSFSDPVPEPATLALTGAGLLAAGLLYRRKAA